MNGRSASCAGRPAARRGRPDWPLLLVTAVAVAAAVIGLRPATWLLLTVLGLAS